MLAPLALLSLFCAAAPPDAPDVPSREAEVSAKVKPAVALLEVLDRTGEKIASGTGFVVSPGGMTVTNVHVVEGAPQVLAIFADGRRRKALGLLATNEQQDVALIQLEGGDYPSLALGSSAGLAEGTEVVVVGSPLGLASTVSHGIVSAARRELPEEFRRRGDKIGPLVQITAPISPGSSGSPVVTMDGKVVAVAQSLLVFGVNINFAVPVEVARELMAALPAGAAPRPFKPFPLANAIASGIFLAALALSLVGFKMHGWLRARRLH